MEAPNPAPGPQGSGNAKPTLGRLRRFRSFLRSGLWDNDLLETDTLHRTGITTLRILAIAWSGLLENRLFSRAAALSYSSLIALGPLVAIIVFLSGSFIQTDAETQIKRALLFVAPSLQEMISLQADTPSDRDVELSTALDELIAQIVEGAEALVQQINTSGSKAFGTIGSLILIWVVIQLLTSVETTLNQIWGVHQGRPWGQRIVFYWTFISLGALLGLGSAALFSASNIAAMTDWMPLGREMGSLAIAISPVISFGMLVLLLAFFYRFFPNTSVGFRPALAGSIFTAILLILNNYLSILYVSRVISFQSLYGSLGILPVMMIGLYFFWVLVLLGGQLTYAVQNVRFLTSQEAWRRVCPLARELVTLAAFLLIARRFQSCEPAPRITGISQHLRVPVNILNESLEMLESMGWINRSGSEDEGDDSGEPRFRPARPMDSYNLSHFRKAIEQAGQTEMLPLILRMDPLLGQYREGLKAIEQESLFQKDLKQLLADTTSAPAQP